MDKLSGRNYEIEWLRFIFSIMIVLNHTKFFSADSVFPVVGCSFGVEFFFLTSGYLMAEHVMKNSFQKNIHSKGETTPLSITSYGSDTAVFLFQKIKKLYLEFFIAEIIGYSFAFIAREMTLKGIIKVLLNSFSEVLLISMFGFKKMGGWNGATWYISSMLIVMAFLYPILVRWRQKALQFIFPLISLLVLGYLCAALGSPRDPTKWLGWIYKGNLRALGEICLGAYTWNLVQWFRAQSWNFVGRTILAFIKSSCYISVMCYVFIYNKGSKFDYAFLLILCLGVALTFSQCTIEILLYEKGKHIFSFLGKYSLCLYLTHFPFSTNLDYVWPADWSILKKMMVYLIICSIAALMVLKISALIRKKIEPIKNILCLVFISKKKDSIKY